MNEDIEVLREALYWTLPAGDLEKRTAANAALDSLSSRMKELEEACRSACEEYRGYEEFDGIRAVLGLPDYLANMAEDAVLSPQENTEP